MIGNVSEEMPSLVSSNSELAMALNTNISFSLPHLLFPHPSSSSFGVPINISAPISHEHWHSRGKLSLCLNAKGNHYDDPRGYLILSTCLLSECSGQHCCGTEGVRVDIEGAGAFGLGTVMWEGTPSDENKKGLHIGPGCVDGQAGVGEAGSKERLCSFLKGICRSVSRSSECSVDLSAALTPWWTDSHNHALFSCLSKAKGSRAGHPPAAVTVSGRGAESWGAEGFAFREQERVRSPVLPGGLGSLSFCEQDCDNSPPHPPPPQVQT